MSLFILFPQMERNTNFIRLQLMCGIPSWLYWLINFIFDMAVYICCILILIVWTAVLNSIVFNDTSVFNEPHVLGEKFYKK